MCINRSVYKRFFTIISLVSIIAMVCCSANAYVHQGGKLNNGVKNQKYYIGITNDTLASQCIQAFSDWNYAMNAQSPYSSLGFSFTRSSLIRDSTIRFWGENVPGESWYGLTRYYIVDNNLNATRVSNAYNRDYSSCILNMAYFDSSYNFPTVLHWKSISAHEIGHAMGLAHTNADGDVGKLMFKGFNVRTATSPTGDEVRGIYYKYN